jgi:hypothetical protein
MPHLLNPLLLEAAVVPEQPPAAAVVRGDILPELVWQCLALKLSLLVLAVLVELKLVHWVVLLEGTPP